MSGTSVNFDIQNIKKLAEFFTSSWYLFLPLSVFVLIFPNLVELVTLLAMGLIVGYGYVSPLIFSFVEKFLPQFSNSLQSNALLYSIIISVIFAVIFYSLYKSIIFLGSFIISFLVGSFLIKSFLTPYLALEWYVYVVIGLLAGLIGGLYAVRNSSKFVGLVSTAVCSFILASIASSFFDKYVFALNNTIFGWIVFVLSLFIFLVRITKLWGVKEHGK